ncbi:phage tail protein [Bdellovibrio reynosensis]|uniref:Fibronectin type III domain-containing protein n=1 Tax=Bdellovibrio reynosensis TaxID=2835041 RepID=A0ABY4CCS6_9BACT|nr:fibronectin type III domain-containing protein [Bdellovibrio reynosensis]UOF01471.1 fibronectin type III domain-containing protein [Bdellovibrio reynosensis]
MPSDGVQLWAPQISGSVATAFYVDGSCHRQTQDVQFSLDQGASWLSANDSSLVSQFFLDCKTDKKFSFVLDLSSKSSVSALQIRSLVGASVSAVIEKNIALDTVLPTATLALDGGVTTLHSRDAILSATGDLDLFKVYLTDQAGCSGGGAWHQLQNMKLDWTFQGNGAQTIYYKFIDFARNESVCQSLNVTIDSSLLAPTALSIAFPLQLESNEVTPSVKIEGLDPGDLVFVYTSSDCSDSTLASSGFSAGTSLILNATILGADGDYQFFAKRRNSFGADSACSTASASYRLDRIAPAAVNPSINAGALITNNQLVSVQLATSEPPHEYYMTANADCTTGGTWAAFQAEITDWNLGVGDGNKTVRVKVRDIAGNNSSCQSVSINLDTTPPDILGLTNSVTPVPSKTWNWSCSEEPCTYEFLVDTVPTTDLSNGFFNSNKTYTIAESEVDAIYYLHIRAKDSAGNISGVYHYKAVVGNFPDAPTSISLVTPASNVSNVTTPSVLVGGVSATNTITLHGLEDCSDAAIVTGTVPGGQSQLILNPTLTVDQVYRFYAKAYNGSNYSGCSLVSLNYTLDRVAPTAVTSLVDGAFSLRNYSPIITWSASTDSLSGVSNYEIQLESISPLTVVTSWLSIGNVDEYAFTGLSLTAGNSYRVRVRTKDLAGNISTETVSDGWSINADNTLAGPLCFTSGNTLGKVNSAIVEGNTIYVGGQFSKVGKCHGGLIRTTDTGTFEEGYNLAGTVSGIIPDGQGGYFVYGLFSLVQGAYSTDNILRLKSDLTVDVSFNLSVNGAINAAAVSSGVLFIGGGFSSVGGVSRANFASVDISSVSSPSILAAVSVNSSVSGLGIDNGYLYIWGSFGSIQGIAKSQLARIDITNPVSPTVDSAFGVSIDGSISALAFDANSVFVGGSFSKVDNVESRSLTVYNKAANTWQKIGTNFYYNGNAYYYSVTSLLVKDAKLYATDGYSFLRLNSTTYSVEAVLSGVPSIAGTGNTGVIVAQANQFSEVNPITMSLTGTFTSLISGGSGKVALKAGNKFLIGGSFVTADTVSRNNLAAINFSDGSLLPWQPSASSYVHSMAKNGNTIAVGGEFTSVSNINRGRFALLDKNSGNVLPESFSFDSYINGLLWDGDRIFAGGAFNGINGTSRVRLGAIDISSGSLLNWDPFPSSTVRQIHKLGTKYIVAGDFTTMQSQSRPGIAMFDVNDLSLLTTNITTSLSSRISTDNGKVVITGAAVAGSSRLLSLFDADMNLIWNTTTSFTSSYYSKPVIGEGVVAVSMNASTSRSIESTVIKAYSVFLANANTSTFNLLPWNPVLGYDSEPLVVTTDAVLVGGSFRKANRVPRSGFAILPRTGDGTPTK